MQHLEILEIKSERLKKIWNELYDSNSLIFQSHQWFISWFECLTVKEKNNVKIIYIYDNDNEKKWLIPIFKKRKFIINNVEIVGGAVIDIKIIISNTKELFDYINFLNFIKKNLWRIHTIKLNFLDKIEKNIFKNSKYEISKCNYYSVSLDKFTYYRNSNKYKKEKNDILRQTNRLKKYGNINFKVINHTDKNFYTILQNIIQLKKKWYLKNNIDVNEISNDISRFYELVSKNPIDYTAEITITALNNEIIAGCLGFTRNNYFYYIYPAYSESWSLYSPGKIHLYNMIDHYHIRGYKHFDLSVGNESYKMKLNPDIFLINSIRLYHGYLGNLLYFISKIYK